MLVIDSEKVRHIMFENQLGVNEVADAAKLQTTTVSHMSRFDKNVTIKTVGKFAKALNVEPKEIIKAYA